MSASELLRAFRVCSLTFLMSSAALAQPPGNPDGGRGRFRGGNQFSGGGPTERVEPADLEFRNGTDQIPDHATYRSLSYRGQEVMIDTFLADLEFVKFTLDGAGTKEQRLYFINTNTHRAHHMFGRAVGLSRGRSDTQMKGVLVYRPMLKSPSGKAGLYTFEFEPFDAYSAEMVKTCQQALTEKAPILEGNLGYFPRGERALAVVRQSSAEFKSAGVTVYLDEHLMTAAIGYLPLNLGESYGRLRVMSLDERPSPRDVVIYDTLPNEMPRVAGIITSVRQTPLSHVNLRAVQDKIPNAFVTNAAKDSVISPLIGKYVAYRVTRDGYEIREATQAEVESHFDRLRPASVQKPVRDLKPRRIRKLTNIGFSESPSVGVKAANLAAMHQFKFEEGTLPRGHAVPFVFYDEFMKHNGFYDHVSTLLADQKFTQNDEDRSAKLKELRSQIKTAEMPDWMMSELAAVHQSYPDGTSLRCRSSTNNEDLPGFSGAGLYDSYTHHPEEGHLAKSVKQVFASMWNDRAFEERDFYRIDHRQAAMGVLIHPNYSEELANGVAVTTDVLYQTPGTYYLNTQLGEDLVTNPEESSVPEEALLDWWNSQKFQVMRTSSHDLNGRPLLSEEHREKLRINLAKVHGKFARLYKVEPDDPSFAMEIEFKVTSDGQLVIKQARPWVFSTPLSSEDSGR